MGDHNSVDDHDHNRGPDSPVQDARQAAPTSRRDFLKSSALGLVAGATPTTLLAQADPASASAESSQTLARLQSLARDPNRRIVIKGGIVLSLDPAVGDFEQADVLIQGKKILAVGPNLNATGEVIDASGMIVMPGFITTHNHQYECLQRSIISDGLIVFAGNASQESALWPSEAYGTVVQSIWTAGRIPDPAVPGQFIWDLGRPPYDPQDNYISELVASLNQLTQGITMGTDTSQASHTPEYTDAMIQALVDSGRRMVYDYSNGTNRGQSEYPGAIGNSVSGIGRLAKQYFSSKDQLLTLGYSGGPTAAFAGATYTGWQLGRAFGAILNSHNIAGSQTAINAAADPRNGTDWSDVTFVHCTRWQDNASPQISIDPVTSKSAGMEIFAARGGHISDAVIIEMQMRHGMPATQIALNHGILPSLSPDVETNMTTDPFSLMRGVFCQQRALANDFAFDVSNPNQLPTPQLLTCRQVLEMATIAGAAANGVLDKVGTLTPGKEADIVLLDAAESLNTAPINNVPGAIVTLMDTRNVRHVMVAGKVVVWNGRLVGWDVKKLTRDITAARDRVLARINGPAVVGTIPPGNNSFSNPYRPNFLGSCCFNGQNTTAPPYVLRP